MAQYLFSAAPSSELIWPPCSKRSKGHTSRPAETALSLTALNLKNAAFMHLNQCFCPGRVNLIGEHMDYNGGESLPFAIDLGLHFEVFSQETDTPGVPEIWIGSAGQRVIARGLYETLATELNSAQNDVAEPEACKINGLCYIQGAWNLLDELLELRASGHETAFNTQEGRQTVYAIVVSGNLPAGAGLSSSAAFTIGLLWCFSKLRNAALSSEEMALLAQKVEHQYAGTPCGLMDQIAILETPPNGLLAVRFDATNAQGFPSLEQMSFGRIQELYLVGIFHSGRNHQLSDGSYQSRQEECQRALPQLCSAWQKQLATSFTHEQSLSLVQECNTLGKLYRFLTDQTLLPPEAILTMSCDFLSDPIEKKRVRFVFEEMARVKDMKEALKLAQFNKIHELLSQAHAGLAQLYEVSCKEIETAVDLILALHNDDASPHRVTPELPLCLGPRMKGGGFGGSLILFVLKSRKHEFDRLISEAINKYETLTRCQAKFYYVNPQTGLGLAQNARKVAANEL